MKTKTKLFFCLTLLFFLISLTLLTGCDPSEQGEPDIDISPTTVDLAADKDKAFLVVNNTGDDEASVTVASSDDWIEITPSSRRIEPGQNYEFTITVDRNVLEPGSHSGSILVSSQNDEKRLDVSLFVVEETSFRVDPLRLDFGSSNSSSFFTIYAQGEGSLDWAASTPVDWLTLDQIAGPINEGESQRVTVRVDRKGLSPGSHSASIRITGDGVQKTEWVEIIVDNIHEVFTPPQTGLICPKKGSSGDRNFGNGPLVEATVELKIRDGNRLIADIWLQMKETAGDGTSGEINKEIVLFQTRGNDRIQSILTDTYSEARYLDTDDDLDMPEVRVGNLVREFSFQGSTTGNDFGKDANCSVEDSHMIIVFNEIRISIAQD